MSRKSRFVRTEQRNWFSSLEIRREPEVHEDQLKC